MKTNLSKPSFYLVSLGCPKNRVDSEVVLGVMTEAGFEFTDQATEAEIIIVNTCSFIQSATEESINTILELGQMKTSGKCARLVVIGCMPQRYKDELRGELPEVDLFLGTEDFYKIPEVLDELERGKEYRSQFIVPKYLYDDTTPRINTQPGYTSYIKIAEGCSSPCTFCIIPKLRGPQRSRQKNSIIEEAKGLARAGVKEVNLIAQETTAYGADLSNGQDLVSLLEGLVSVEGLYWIRLLYGYPFDLPQGLLELIQEQDKICKYLDLPIQHINQNILENMGRRGDSDQIRKLIERIRAHFPQISLRTTVIVGFPGETDKAFQELLQYLADVQFDHLGVFGFSSEEGTPAADLPGKNPVQTIQSRVQEVMRTQVDIARDRCLRFMSQKLPVLVEGKSQESDLFLQGRTEFQAPEIDGHVLINKGIANVGDIVQVQITETLDYDLVGCII